MEISLSPSNSASQLIVDGWFNEVEAMWPGQRFSLKVEEVLLNGRSEFQDILVFKSTDYGTVLILDGVIQVTERDEFSYQEMIAHVPLFANRDPKKVLIIGGGDGGVLREVCKHKSVEVIHMCEIDPQVIAVAKKYFANSTATAYHDPRVKLIFDDAAKFLKEEGRGANYDCIISDSSDPVGLAMTLYQREFYESMRDALGPGGVICNQSECQWNHLDFITNLIKECSTIFPVVRYAYTSIPTYPSGQIGFLIMSNDHAVNPAEPQRPVNLDTFNTENDVNSLRYYSSNIHRAAFVLPVFAAKIIEPLTISK